MTQEHRGRSGRRLPRREVFGLQHHVHAGGEHPVDARERVGELLRESVGHAGLFFGRRRDHALRREDVAHRVEFRAREIVLAHELKRLRDAVAFDRDRIAFLVGSLFGLDPVFEEHRHHGVRLRFRKPAVDLRLAARQKQGRAGAQNQGPSDAVGRIRFVHVTLPRVTTPTATGPRDPKPSGCVWRRAP